MEIKFIVFQIYNNMKLFSFETKNIIYDITKNSFKKLKRLQYIIFNL